MKKITLMIISLIFLWISQGLADLSLTPVTNPSERITTSMGLSILPPQEQGWYFITNNPGGGLHIVKTLNPLASFECALVVAPIQEEFKNPDEFLNYIKKVKLLTG